MAAISRENMATMTDKITVRLTKDDYMPAFEASLKKYAKSANIPGFRKGMVPAGVIKKMYGSGVFMEEVLRSVERELNKHVQDEKLELLGQPLPLTDPKNIDMNNPVEYEFVFEAGLRPNLNINLQGITVTRHRVNVTDAMVDDEVEQLKNRYGKLTDQEEVTSDDNVLNVTFTETDADGKDIDSGIVKGNSLLVKYFADDFRKQLLGKKKDESVVLQLSRAFGDKEREWLLEDLGIAKGDAEAADKFFRMMITKVGLIEKPEMNEDFFGKAIPGKSIQSESDFREAIKQGIQVQWDAQTRNQLQDQLFHKLVDNTQIDLPDQFLKRWLQEGEKEKRTAEEAEKEYPSYANTLKWSLISNNLVEQLDVHVERDEIRQFTKQQMLGYMQGQVSDDAPWLDSYIDKMLEDKKHVESSYQGVLTNKMFNLLEEKVNVIEDTVTPDELINMQHHHSH